METTIEEAALGQEYALVDALLHEQHVETILLFLAAHLGFDIWFVMSRTSRHSG